MNKVKTETLEKSRAALIMKSLADDFFKTMENSARAHQKAHTPTSTG